MASAIKSNWEPTVKKQLESFVFESNQAINDRIFDLEHPVFRDNVDPSFKGIPRPTATPTSSAPLAPEEYLATLRDVCKEYPDYHIKVLDTWSSINTKFAKVYANYEITGGPPGLVFRSVAVFQFRRDDDGEWKCFELDVADVFPGL